MLRLLRQHTGGFIDDQNMIILIKYVKFGRGISIICLSNIAAGRRAFAACCRAFATGRSPVTAGCSAFATGRCASAACRSACAVFHCGNSGHLLHRLIGEPDPHHVAFCQRLMACGLLAVQRYILFAQHPVDKIPAGILQIILKQAVQLLTRHLRTDRQFLHRFTPLCMPNDAN